MREKNYGKAGKAAWETFYRYRHARQQSTGGRSTQMGPSAVRLHLLKPDFPDAGKFSTERRKSLGTGSYAGFDGA